jgi:hypothetical protein
LLGILRLSSDLFIASWVRRIRWFVKAIAEKR